ncbi:MAG: lantibiotic dehydratase [Saprospiraceae bacterium]
MVNIIYLEHGLVNNLIHVKDVSPFASRSLTRFSVLNEEIREFCEELSRIESNTSEDTIIAEIIHIPSLKHASIMQRDVSFNYNIPLVARQENKDQNEILCNDILVSVTNNRIVLRSKSLGKQIIPRLSSAFNYTLSDFPIFQFLCELQYQDISDGWNFNWGILEDQIGFRPRVKYKNVILSPASWRFRKKDLMNLLSINNSENKMSNFTEFRRFNNIPQIVNISTNEGELFLDTNSILCIDILVNIVGKLDENDLVILFENLSQFGYSNVLNTKGKVENEYLFSFVNLNI